MTQANNVSNPPRVKEAAISSLIEKTGYGLNQENGQRKYGPPPDWTDPPPPKGSEVFVGKIPRDLFEDELVPVFEKVGKIYEARLMMDFSGNNRGYAFVTFTCPEDAKRAVKELDNYEIRKGKSIGVCKSVDNCRLFVGGIPKTKTKEEILAEMKKITDNVSDVILYSSILDKSKNRGFAFVEYDTHKAAAMARRKLMPGKIQLWGHEVAVDWAEPEIEVDEDTMSKVTVLYVRNLMQNTTEEFIKEVFSLEGSLKIEKVKKLRDFAFVHFGSREDAEKALAELNNTEMDGSVVEVTWAKPVDRSTRPRITRAVSSSTVPTYSHYIYGALPIDSYPAHVPFPQCPVTRGPMIQRVPMTRRARGAAGIRRYRNYAPPTNRTLTYKPLEVPFTSLPPPHFSHQYQPSKLGRIPEEGKPYHQGEYHYIPAPQAPDGNEPTIAPLPGAAYSIYPNHARIGPPYFPVFTAYEESPFFSYIPPPTGAV